MDQGVSNLGQALSEPGWWARSLPCHPDGSLTPLYQDRVRGTSLLELCGQTLRQLHLGGASSHLIGTMEVTGEAGGALPTVGRASAGPQGKAG